MINIGILGCADIAKRLMIPNLIASGRFNVKSIASRNIEKALSFSTIFSCEPVDGYNKLVTDQSIDAIYIPLPISMHHEWIIKALRNNKHVISEKSITHCYSATKEIIEIAGKKELCVFENFMFPFHSQFDFVKEKIEKNEIGKIRLLRSSFGFPLINPNTNIRYKKELAGGSLLDAGAYTLMAAQLFLGREQEVISSNLENRGHEVDFFGSIVLKNEEGIISQLAFGFDNFYQNNIEIWGSKGKIVIERAFTAGPAFTPKIIFEKQDEKQEIILPADNHFIKIISCFANCIETNQFDFQYEQILNQSALIEKVFNMAGRYYS